MLGVPPTRSLAQALPELGLGCCALTTAFSAPRSFLAGFGEPVPPLAMSLSGMSSGCSLTTQDVFTIRDDFEMIGIDACSLPTEVIERHALLDRPVVVFVE